MPPSPPSRPKTFRAQVAVLEKQFPALQRRPARAFHQQLAYRLQGCVFRPQAGVIETARKRQRVVLEEPTRVPAPPVPGLLEPPHVLTCRPEPHRSLQPATRSGPGI